MIIKNRLEELMFARDLNITELSKLSGITTGCIYQIKVGNVRLPSERVICRLCEALGIEDIEDFIYLWEENTNG